MKSRDIESGDWREFNEWMGINVDYEGKGKEFTVILRFLVRG